MKKKKRHLSTVVAWRNKLWFLLETSEAIYYYCHGTIIQERNRLLECTVQTGPLSQEGYLVPLTVLSLHTGRTVSWEATQYIQAYHRLGQWSALGRKFPRNSLYHFPFYSHVQRRIVLPFGILSSKPEVCKGDVDHRRVATTAIFINSQRIAAWGTWSFGDHQELLFTFCISLPSISTTLVLPSFPPHTASRHSLLLSDCNNWLLFGLGFETLLRGQKAEMTKHLGSVSSFDRISKASFQS